MPTRGRNLTSSVVFTIVCLAIVQLPSGSAFARAPNFPWEGPPVRVKPGRLVVTFEPGTSPAERRAVHADVGAHVTAHGRVSRSDVVAIPPELPAAAAIRRYEAEPNVLAAELDRYSVSTLIPNDPEFPNQWALRNTGQQHEITGGTGSAAGTPGADVKASEAWDVATAGADIVVAVLDSGVDIDHEDLANVLWVNEAEQSGTDGVDDDGNGYVDDIHGWDFRGHDADPSPGPKLAASHGTHVAGIVAAERDNGIGVAGLCGACRIMALRFDFSLGQEVEAIEYAVANGADIINMSFVSPVWSPAERAAIEAAGDAGVLTVAAAGNSSLDNDIPTYVEDSFSPAFPASYTLPTILSVAASNHRDHYGYVTACDRRHPRWTCAFTSWGANSVDVAAPGVDIISTVSPAVGEYRIFDGTSMASPHVAGIAGLVKHEHPEDGPVDLKNAVMNSVDHPSALKLWTSWADLTGVSKRGIAGRFTRTQGRVNGLAALTASTANATPLTDGNIDGAKAMDRTVRGHVAWPADVNDVYKKRLKGGNRYRVTLDGPRGRDFDLWVWTPKAIEIHQFTIGCFRRRGACPALKGVSGGPDADEQVTFSVRNTDVYYIQVQGWYSSGAYTLSVRRV